MRFWKFLSTFCEMFFLVFFFNLNSWYTLVTVTFCGSNSFLYVFNNFCDEQWIISPNVWCTTNISTKMVNNFVMYDKYFDKIVRNENGISILQFVFDAKSTLNFGNGNRQNFGLLNVATWCSIVQNRGSICQNFEWWRSICQNLGFKRCNMMLASNYSRFWWNSEI